MSDMLLRRRSMMATKWEPNLIIGTRQSTESISRAGNLLGFSAPTRIRFYKDGVLRQARGTLFNFGSLGVDMGTAVEAMVPPNVYVDINAYNDIYKQNGIYAKGLKFKNTTSSRQTLKCGQGCTGQMIFENCQFYGPQLSSSDSFYYDSVFPIVKFKDCYFETEPYWLSVIYPSRVIYDNINLTTITRYKGFWYNSNIVELSVVNNPVLTQFLMTGDGYNRVANTFEKIDFSNNPNLTKVRLQYTSNWNTDATKQVFIDFVNSLPLREENNRGTLQFMNNPYINNADVINILAAKNWDYVAFS